MTPTTKLKCPFCEGYAYISLPGEAWVNQTFTKPLEETEYLYRCPNCGYVASTTQKAFEENRVDC